MDKKKYTLLFSLLILLTFLNGCRRAEGGYSGKFVAESASIQSSLVNAGLTNEPAREHIKIIDEDTYGRRLFISESYLQVAPSVSENKKKESDEKENLLTAAIGIIQKTDEDTHIEYVYYYEDINFIRKDFKEYTPKESSVGIEEFFMTLLERFSQTEIEDLKIENDWDKPLDESKMSRIKIFREKKDIISSSKRLKAYLEICEILKLANNWILNESYLVSDNNGKSIYFFRDGYWEDKNQYIFTTPYLIMFNKNGEVIPETGIFKLDDSLDYSSYTDKLIEFKKVNGWDMSA